MTGFVHDTLDAEVPGACIYWYSGGNFGAVKADSHGVYDIRVLLDPTDYVYLYAVPYKNGVPDYSKYSFQFKKLSFTDAVIPQNYYLPYLLNTTVTPAAFKNSPQKTITFVSYSPAPRSGYQFVLQLPSGARLPMDYDVTYSDPNGWQRFTASWSVPLGTTNGTYQFESCVLVATATGNCDANAPSNPAAPPPRNLISQIASNSFIVDSVAPVLGAAAPVPNHNTTNRQPTISVSAVDGLSGINESTVAATLDGAPASAFYWSGSISFSPAQALALGVHSVSISVSDAAGNAATLSWQFAVVSVTASPTSASVTSVTVNVNPQHKIPPPSQLTFTNVPVSLRSFGLSLSSSPLSSGIAALTRRVVFSNLKVAFANELGQVPPPVSAPITSVTFSGNAAVLEPNSGSLRVLALLKSSSIASVTVGVPAGFVVTDQSTATISSVDQSADSSVTMGIALDPLPRALLSTDCPQSGCVVTGAASCTLAQSVTPTYNCNGTFPRVTMDTTINGAAPVNVLVYVESAETDQTLFQGSSTEFKRLHPNPGEVVPGEPPSCGVANGYSCTNVLGDHSYRLTTYVATGALFRAYSHTFAFDIASSADSTREWLATWQNSDATPTEGAVENKCARLLSFGNAVESQSSWQLSGEPYVAASNDSRYT
ncbi:MAG: hypothetical protein ABR548_10135, partial [Actinomycetota bacterium]